MLCSACRWHGSPRRRLNLWNTGSDQRGVLTDDRDLSGATSRLLIVLTIMWTWATISRWVSGSLSKAACYGSAKAVASESDGSRPWAEHRRSTAAIAALDHRMEHRSHSCAGSQNGTVEPKSRTSWQVALKWGKSVSRRRALA